MTSVIQHPYGESDQDMINSIYSQGDNGYLGYIGPIGCKEGSTCQASGAISHNEFIMIGDGSPFTTQPISQCSMFMFLVRNNWSRRM